MIKLKDLVPEGYSVESENNEMTPEEWAKQQVTKLGVKEAMEFFKSGLKDAAEGRERYWQRAYDYAKAMAMGGY